MHTKPTFINTMYVAVQVCLCIASRYILDGMQKQILTSVASDEHVSESSSENETSILTAKCPSANVYFVIVLTSLYSCWILKKI